MTPSFETPWTPPSDPPVAFTHITAGPARFRLRVPATAVRWRFRVTPDDVIFIYEDPDGEEHSETFYPADAENN